MRINSLIYGEKEITTIITMGLEEIEKLTYSMSRQ